MIRRWLSIGLALLVPGVFVAAFLSMAWIRSQQGHAERLVPSEIEALAVRKGPGDPLADARLRGQKVYRHYCQICHGEDGKGNGFNASRLQRTPRDFTDAKFWNETSEERLHYAVAQGGPSVGKSVLMPAWGHTLTDNQIVDVIVFVRSFASKPEVQSE